MAATGGQHIARAKLSQAAGGEPGLLVADGPGKARGAEEVRRRTDGGSPRPSGRGKAEAEKLLTGPGAKHDQVAACPGGHRPAAADHRGPRASPSLDAACSTILLQTCGSARKAARGKGSGTPPGPSPPGGTPTGFPRKRAFLSHVARDNPDLQPGLLLPHHHPALPERAACGMGNWARRCWRTVFRNQPSASAMQNFRRRFLCTPVPAFNPSRAGEARRGTTGPASSHNSAGHV